MWLAFLAENKLRLRLALPGAGRSAKRPAGAPLPQSNIFAIQSAGALQRTTTEKAMTDHSINGKTLE
jgi:hypothetical protein